LGYIQHYSHIIIICFISLVLRRQWMSSISYTQHQGFWLIARSEKGFSNSNNKINIIFLCCECWKSQHRRIKASYWNFSSPSPTCADFLTSTFRIAENLQSRIRIPHFHWMYPQCSSPDIGTYPQTEARCPSKLNLLTKIRVLSKVFKAIELL